MPHSNFLLRSSSLFRFRFLALASFLGVSACASSPDIGFEIKGLDALVTSVRLWVVAPTTKQGAALTCKSLLDSKQTPDAASFDIKANRLIPFGSDASKTVSLDQLPLGRHLFLVGGYKNDQETPQNLRYLGCQDAILEAGKKTHVSLFLALVNP